MLQGRHEEIDRRFRGDKRRNAPEDGHLYGHRISRLSAPVGFQFGFILKKQIRSDIQ
jgi:hypothetical protein